MGSRVDVNPEAVLCALAHTARRHDGFGPGSPAAAVIWAVDEIRGLRERELRAADVAEQLAATQAENARLREVLASRTPNKGQWEHAAQLLHRWVSDIRWCSASESARIKSRTRVGQIGVELGLVDL